MDGRERPGLVVCLLAFAWLLAGAVTIWYHQTPCAPTDSELRCLVRVSTP